MTVNFTKEELAVTLDAVMFRLVENGKGNINLDVGTCLNLTRALWSLREAISSSNN